MKRLCLLAVFVVTSATIWGCSPGSDKPAHPEWREQLGALMDQSIADNRLPGMILGVFAPDQDFEFFEARGVADVAGSAPMKTDKVVRIGSNTKVFVSTVLLQLVDEGLVSLDAPVAAYLDGVPNGEQIRMRNILNNTSGLFPYSSDDDFGRALVSDPFRQWQPQELLAYSFRHPVVFQPGTQFQYSNTNWIVQGVIVEKLTGNTLASEVTRRIIQPLFLKHTIFPEGNEIPGDYAHGYGYGFDGTGELTDMTDYNPSWGWAAGAMISTMDDMRRWVHALVKGNMLSPALQEKRLTEFTPFPLSEIYSHSFYGLGIADLAGFYGHNGELPGYNTQAVYDPEHNITVVMAMNLYVAVDIATLQSVLDIVLPGRKL